MSSDSPNTRVGPFGSHLERKCCIEAGDGHDPAPYAPAYSNRAIIIQGRTCGLRLAVTDIEKNLLVFEGLLSTSSNTPNCMRVTSAGPLCDPCHLRLTLTFDAGPLSRVLSTESPLDCSLKDSCWGHCRRDSCCFTILRHSPHVRILRRLRTLPPNPKPQISAI